MTTYGLPCVTDHECAPAPGRRVFCGECGKVVDRTELHGVRIEGFLGGDSLNPKVEAFWQTGDAAVFAKPGAPDYLGPNLERLKP